MKNHYRKIHNLLPTSALVMSGRRHSLASESGRYRHLDNLRRSSLDDCVSECSEASSSIHEETEPNGEIKKLFVRTFNVSEGEKPKDILDPDHEEKKLHRKKSRLAKLLETDLVLEESEDAGKIRKRRTLDNNKQEQKSPNRTSAMRDVSRSRTPCRSENRQEQKRRSRTPRASNQEDERSSRRSLRTPKHDESVVEDPQEKEAGTKRGRRNLFDSNLSTSESVDVDEIIANMPYLKPHETNREKGYNPAQSLYLNQVFELTWHPTVEHKTIMSEKLGVPFEKLRYWFDNNRRKFLKLVHRGENLDSTAYRRHAGRDGEGFISPRPEKSKVSRPDKSNSAPRSSKIVNYLRKKIKASEDSLDEVIESGVAICIGVALDKRTAKCLLCPSEFDDMGDLTTHLNGHKFKGKFCKVYREQGDLEVRYRGCRKVFSEETFNDHHCTSKPPVYFSTDPVSRRSSISSRRPSAAVSVTSVTSSEGGKLELKEKVDELTNAGFSVCIGFEIENITYCNLCKFSCTIRGNMFRHFQLHRVTYKFCSIHRDNGKPGCAKMFTAETFDLHDCTLNVPEPIGNFPLSHSRGVKLEDRPFQPGFDYSSAEEDSEEEEAGEEDEESEEDDEDTEEEVEDKVTEVELAAEMLSAGSAVCIAYEISDSCSQCTFCDYFCSVRGRVNKFSPINNIFWSSYS